VHPWVRALSKHSRLPGRKREKCKNERRKAILQHTSQRLIALAGERAGPRDYKKCTGEGETRERESEWLFVGALFTACAGGFSLLLYIFLAPGDNHTPLYMRQRVETRSKRKEKTSVALLLLVSPSTRGDSPPPPPHTALLYSQQWCWLQFSLIPLSTWSSFFLYSSSRARCPLSLYTHTMPARGPFTIQYKLLGADAAVSAAALLLPNCHYLIRRKRKLYDGGSEANKTSRGPLFFSFSRAVGLIARCISFNPNNKQLCC
jgi:hypothetical protein